MFEFEGETAIVTASTSGFGKASARALAERGANVTICGRDEGRLSAATDDLEDAGDGGVLGVRADITDPDDVASLVSETASRFGGVDHVVTSTGSPASGGFTDVDRGDWDAAVDLILLSVVWLIDEAAPHLRDGGGTITTLAATSVREPHADLVLSSALRPGVVGLTTVLSREFAPGVRANAVLPGAHRTEGLRALVEEEVADGIHDSYEAGLEAWASDVPLGRLGRPAELGDTVAFLASDLASYITGTAVTVDGGRSRGY